MRPSRLIPLVVIVPVALSVAGLFHPDDLTVDTADRWTILHAVLLPVFPLLALGFPVLLRGDAGPVAVVARVAAYVYAVFYTGLDAVAGIGSGSVLAHTDGPVAQVQHEIDALFDMGNLLGIIGSGAFLVASAAASVALVMRYGRPALPGAVVLVVASVPFLYSHIYWPVGGLTMLGLALGFGLLAWAVRPTTTSGV